MNIDGIIQKILEYKSDSDTEFLRTVYSFTQKAQGGKKNKVGISRIQVAVGVAHCLVELHPDLYSVAAAMLYDIPRLTNITWELIRREFGTVPTITSFLT